MSKPTKKQSKPRKRTSSARVGEPVETPHPHDILCGRGGQANYHIGNLNYRALVDLNKSLYAVCQKKHKQLISKSIVATIARQDPPGRFLEQDGKSGLWYEIEDKWAVRKTSQALREEQMEDSLTILGLDEKVMSLSLETPKSPELSSISAGPGCATYGGSPNGGSPRQASSENSGTAVTETISRRKGSPKGNANKSKKLQTKKRPRVGAAGKKATALKKRKTNTDNEASTQKAKATIESISHAERSMSSSQHSSPHPEEVCWHQVFTSEVQEFICSSESNSRKKSKAPVRVSLDTSDPSVSVLELGQWLDGVEFDGYEGSGGPATPTKAVKVICDCESHQSECATCNEYRPQPIDYIRGPGCWEESFNEVSDEDSFAPIL